MLQIVGAIGQNAAIELRLVGRQLIKLRLHASVLMIGEQVLQARVGVEAARGSGLQLRARARLTAVAAEAGCA